jgi:predicted nucleic acid-binding protein
MTGKPTFDTNVLIYAFGQHDDERKHIAKEIITKCNIISIQVVNETACVLMKKFKFQIQELDRVTQFIKKKFVVSDLNLHVLDHTLKIADQFGFSFWDSMIVAAVLENHCTVLYTEDLQHKRIIEGRLEIINPFQKG